MIAGVDGCRAGAEGDRHTAPTRGARREALLK